MKNQNNNIENSIEENLTYNNENQYNDIFSEQSQKSFKIKGKVKYNKEIKEQNEIKNYIINQKKEYLKSRSMHSKKLFFSKIIFFHKKPRK